LHSSGNTGEKLGMICDNILAIYINQDRYDSAQQKVLFNKEFVYPLNG
jgi:hypothetical protein